VNYRRGFQRFFVAVSIGWVTLWLYLLWPNPAWLISRPIQHYRFIRIKGLLIPIDTLNRLTANEKAQAVKMWLAEKGNEPTKPAAVELLSDEEKSALASGEKDPSAIALAESPERYEHDVLVLLGMSASGPVWKFAWKAWRGPVATAFVPPALFYFLFFYVGRWIYRGFRKTETASVV